MRVPIRGRHSAAETLLGVGTWLLLLTGLVVLIEAVGVRHGAHATTPPAPAITPTLEPPTPQAFEFVDKEYHCHYFASSAGGMTPRLKGVNAQGLGMPLCDP